MIRSLLLYTVLCFFLYSFSYGQVYVQKETIYISYDECKKRDKISDEDRIRFVICSENFLFEATIDSKRKYSYDRIKDSLITVHQAKEKVKEYLERVAKEFKKQSKNESEKKISSYIKNIGIYYYNSYFNAIYIFEKKSEEEGILYEVSWESYIEQ